MRDRKTRDSYRYRRSPYEKGPKRKARTSEKAGKRRRRRELLKDLGPRTSRDRESESPRVERPERTADLCQMYRVRPQKDRGIKARTSEKAGKRRRRRELLKGPRTSDLERPRDRESESRKTRKTADLCQMYRVRPQKDRGTKARTSEKAGKRRRRRELLKGPRTARDRETESPRVERPERTEKDQGLSEKRLSQARTSWKAHKRLHSKESHRTSDLGGPRDRARRTERTMDLCYWRQSPTKKKDRRKETKKILREGTLQVPTFSATITASAWTPVDLCYIIIAISSERCLKISDI